MSARVRLGLLVAALTALWLVVLLAVARSPSAIRDFVDEGGALAPLLFVPVSVALSSSFFPGPLLAGASGLLFGTALGTPVTIVSTTLAAIVQFTIGRRFGRGAAEELAGPRVQVWKERAERHGFLFVLYVRLAPLMPFTTFNYAAGLTRIALPHFAAATAIGVSPRAFAYTALGGSFRDLSSPEAIVAIALLVTLWIGGAIVFLRGRRRMRAEEREQAEAAPAIERASAA
jgi:uncharacterized membrane protein YdjX (TVP38/TMEM64 family)